MNARMWFLVLLTLGILIAGSRLSHWVEMPGFAAQGGPPVKWKQKLPDLVSSAPAIGKNGLIYVTTRTGPVYALDRSGTIQWAYRPEYSPSSSAMMLDKDGNVYFSMVDKVFSLTANGEKRWEADCPGSVFRMSEHGALGDGVLYTTCGDNFSALSTSDGQELWRVHIGNSDDKAVVLKDGALVVNYGWSLSTFDSTGNSLWTFPPPNYVLPPPRKGLISDQPFLNYPAAIGKDETLYLGSNDSQFSAFTRDGALKWTYDVGFTGPMDSTRFASSPVITADETVIAVSNKAVAYAFTPQGTLLWKTRLGDPIRSVDQPSPVVGKDGMIYAFADHKLVGLTPEGKQSWFLMLSDDATVPPTLAPDGTLYVATNDGLLYALKTGSKGLAQSSWPKYQGDLSNSGRF